MTCPHSSCVRVWQQKVNNDDNNNNNKHWMRWSLEVCKHVASCLPIDIDKGGVLESWKRYRPWRSMYTISSGGVAFRVRIICPTSSQTKSVRPDSERGVAAPFCAMCAAVKPSDVLW